MTSRTVPSGVNFPRSWLLLVALGMFPAGCGGDSRTQAPDSAAEGSGQADIASTIDLSSGDLQGDDTGKPGNEDLYVGPEDTALPTCFPRPAMVPVSAFFEDVSVSSGIRKSNAVIAPAQKIPINDHSRLAFADLNGDGYDDIVMHSLFPNPQGGVPFEHLVFLNDGNGSFTDFSTESGLRDVQAGFFAFGDVDNDGDQDVFAGLDVPLTGKTHSIHLNDGSGRFEKRNGSGVDVVTIPTVAGNAAFADFDGDGLLDLYVGNGHTSYKAQDILFLGNGDGTFKNAFTHLEGNPQQPSNGSVTCDVDNDGDLDILVSTYGISTALGLNILWENEEGIFTNKAVERGFASLATGNYWLESTGYGTLEEPGKEPGSFVGSNGFGLDCGDVNNDGLMDVFLTTISHPNSLDYNRKWSDPSQVLINQGPQGGWAFVNEFLSKGLPFNEGDLDGAMVDFDNDGRLDLSLSREKKYEAGYSDDDQKGWFGLMRQLPDGNFDNLGLSSGINAPEAQLSASLTDCVTDSECPDPAEKCLLAHCRRPCTGDDDCPEKQEVCGYYWSDALGKTQNFCKLLQTMKMAQNHAWSDVDHDGDMDLLAGGRDTGGGRPNFLFRNLIGSQNRWLAVRLAGDGQKVNRDAIGTRVSLVFGDRTLSREVRSSRGMYNSADTRVLHFGLGDLGCDYQLRVRWPDGTESVFHPTGFPEESYLRITYPDLLEVRED